MNRIHELRKINKMKQQDLAILLNVKQNTISNWESGRTEIDQQSLSTLADYFGISIDYLLGREEKPLIIPKEYRDLPIAFYEGVEGLNQEDIDDVVNFMEYLKNKKKK